MKKIKVIGAGMSGLLSAFYLLEKGYQVEVYESQAEAGGKIQTRKSPLGLMEKAANAFLADKEVETVAQKIGVDLIRKKNEARRRYIFRDDLFSRWPLGCKGTWSVFRFYVSYLFNTKRIQPEQNELLQTWGYRVLGREVTDYLVGPACLGIFGVDSKYLSATLIFRYFFSKHKRQKGKWRGSVAPSEGMGAFVLGLRKYLESQGVTFHFNKTFELQSNGKKEGPLVFAGDWLQAQTFLEKIKDERAKILSQVPAVDLFSVNVFYDKKPKKQKIGFGALFPRGQGHEPLGVLFNSHIFPGRSEGSMSETWIYGRTAPSSQRQWTDAEFMDSIQRTRRNLWNEEQTPLEAHVNRWPTALPLYGVDLENALQRLPVDKDGVYLMGNYFGEIGLNRLFHRAKVLAEQIHQYQVCLPHEQN